MSIFMKRKDGTTTPYRNAEFIPAYLFIPEEIIQKCPQEIKRLPRQVGRFFRDWNTIEIIESDLFLELIIDAYASMVWPYMGVGGSMERFSGYEPAWIFAHSPAYWIQGLMDAGVMPTAEELGNLSPETYVDFVSLEAASALLSFIVPLTMEKHDMPEIIEVAREFRCFEDFDTRNSNQKTDFYRRWYHTRSIHAELSLEQLLHPDSEEDEDGKKKERDLPDPRVDVDEEVVAAVDADRFLAGLSEKDRQILLLRLSGHTLEEIADKLGYKNHSGVLKRIRKIGNAYEKYAGIDLGFRQQKITA